MPRAILFDLDGTLVDTRAASWELFSETNLAFKLGIDSRDAFFAVFEGNFFESLARLCPDPQRAEAAKQHFMELLRTRYRPALIPGMTDVVRALAPHCTLAVVSTNGIEAIRRILVDAGIATCFSHVFSGDVQPKKSASIRRFQVTSAIPPSAAAPLNTTTVPATARRSTRPMSFWSRTPRATCGRPRRSAFARSA